jgi:hypothetical protein
MLDGQSPPEGSRGSSRSDQRLVEARSKIVTVPALDDRKYYMHALLTQLGIPRAPTEKQLYERRSGDWTLALQAGPVSLNGKLEPQKLPFGPHPRVILSHLCTQAKLAGCREISLGRSLRSFVVSLGYCPDGRTYKSFKEQLLALAGCRFIGSFPAGGRVRQISVIPFKIIEWNEVDDVSVGKIVIWLDQDWFESLSCAAVPGRAEALRQSSLALDLYWWLAHRLWRASLDGDLIPWPTLFKQLGGGYSSVAKFRDRFEKTILKVQLVYPEARIKCSDEGVVVKKSSPPVPRTKPIRVNTREVDPDVSRRVYPV